MIAAGSKVRTLTSGASLSLRTRTVPSENPRERSNSVALTQRSCSIRWGSTRRLLQSYPLLRHRHMTVPSGRLWLRSAGLPFPLERPMVE